MFLNPVATGQLHHVGGTCTYPTAGDPIASGTLITLSRLVPLTQETSISNQGDFYPVVTEQALDELCLQIQQVSNRTGQDRGTWAVGVSYNNGDLVQDGAAGAGTLNYYVCVIANVATNWAADLAAGDWSLAINVQQINGYATSAATSAAAAATSATNASTNATAAATSATTASNAATSASNAATSASTSAANAQTAATQASNAVSSSATSAANAAASATAATNASTAATLSAGQSADSATTALISANNAGTSATSAAASAAQAAGSLLGTSGSSNSIGTGAKTYVTQAGLSLGPGGFVTIANTAAPANYNHGQITSYSGTSLVVNVLDTGGTGTFSAWTITPSAPQGSVIGTAGTINSGTATQLAYYATSDTVLSGDVNATIVIGDLTLGQAGSVRGALILSNASANATTILPAVTGGGTLTLPSGSGLLVATAATVTLTNKTITSPTNILGGVTMTLGSDAIGDIYYRNSGGVLTRLGIGGANTILHGGTIPAYSAVVEADITLADNTTNNVSSTKHGFAPKSPSSASQFLNGAATPVFAAVKDSDLSLTDITTNNVSTSKHGFAPKAPNDAARYLDGTGAYSVPASSTPSGAVTFFAMNTPPSGWLECDGAAVSRSTYAALFSAIGITYGPGNGTTTFNVPDIRGYFIRGWDHGRGVDTGRTFGSAQLDAFQNWVASFLTRMNNATQVVTGAASTSGSGQGASNASTGSQITIDPSGVARTSTETRPVNLALLPCIKT